MATPMLRIYSPEDRVKVAEVREVVLQIRRFHNWSQGQLANKLHVSRKTIERIEQRAVQTVDLAFYQRIRELL